MTLVTPDGEQVRVLRREAKKKRWELAGRGAPRGRRACFAVVCFALIRRGARRRAPRAAACGARCTPRKGLTLSHCDVQVTRAWRAAGAVRGRERPARTGKPWRGFPWCVSLALRTPRGLRDCVLRCGVPCAPIACVSCASTIRDVGLCVCVLSVWEGVREATSCQLLLLMTSVD